MATALDLPVYSPTAAAHPSVAIMDAARAKREKEDEEERRRIAAEKRAEVATEMAKAAAARAAAGETREIDRERLARMPAAAAAEMMQFDSPLAKGQPWERAADIIQEPLKTKYREIAPLLPKLWNDAQTAITGQVVGMPGIPTVAADESVTRDNKGNISIHKAAPQKAESEGVVFQNADEAEKAGFSAEGAEVLPNGNIRVTKMARVDKSRGKFTEAESKSILYLDRMRSAEDGIQNIMAEGYDPTTMKNSVMRGAAGTMANPIADEQTQRYENEQRNFLAGVLRKDTGAAVTDKEFALYGPMFFPTWGDKKGTVAQKAAKRRVAMNAIQKGLSSDLIISGVENPEGTTPAPIPNMPPIDGTVKPSAKLSPDDEAAVAWAKANPTDPRAARIMALHGAK